MGIVRALLSSTDSDAIGPSVSELAESINAVIYFGWVVAFLSIMVNLTLYFSHYSTFDGCALEMRSHRYLSIIRLPLVFGLTGATSLFVVRTSGMWSAIQHAYEAYALYQFYLAIVDLCGGRRALITKLQQKEPQPFYQTPPFCCCCFWLPKVRFSGTVLDYCQRTVIQFVVIVPSAMVAEIMIMVADQEHNAAVEVVVAVLSTVSTFFALHGLFVIYKATHDILQSYGTTLKFVALKALILIGVVQGEIFGFFCAIAIIPPAGPLDSEGTAVFISNICLCLQSPFLLWLSFKTFVPEECMEIGGNQYMEMSKV